eukprot:scaffold1766_cov401-Prasinococcus_capsulatus_cf.AAC.42
MNKVIAWIVKGRKALPTQVIKLVQNGNKLKAEVPTAWQIKDRAMKDEPSGSKLQSKNEELVEVVWDGCGSAKIALGPCFSDVADALFVDGTVRCPQSQPRASASSIYQSPAQARQEVRESGLQNPKRQRGRCGAELEGVLLECRWH